MNDVEAKTGDVVALLRLLHYVREEARRLGLGETARLVDIPTASCLEEAGNTLGLRLPDGLLHVSSSRGGVTH